MVSHMGKGILKMDILHNKQEKKKTSIKHDNSIYIKIDPLKRLLENLQLLQGCLKYGVFHKRCKGIMVCVIVRQRKTEVRISKRRTTMQQNDTIAEHHITPLANHHLVINTFYLQSHHVYSHCRVVQIMACLEKLQNQGVPIVQANL